MGIFGYALCVMGAAICIGVVATSAANNMARQPEVQGRLFTVFILGCVIHRGTYPDWLRCYLDG